MAIFNSLGSNYNFKYVLKSLFADSANQNRKFKNFLEEKYEGRAILTYKGREALTLALKILNLPKESMIAINGFTCFAVYKAIEAAGLSPICLDLDEKNTDLNFSVETLEKTLRENKSSTFSKNLSKPDSENSKKVLDKNIKVVVIQNTLGYPCDINEILKVCKKNNLILIEDLAHCVGTKYLNSKETGNVGDLVVLSFSQDKVIDAVSGGALVIRNKKYQNYKDEFIFKEPEKQMRDKLYPLLTYKVRGFYDLGVGKLLHFVLKKLNLLSKPMQEGLYDFYSLPNWYCNLALNEFYQLQQQLSHRKKIAKIYSDNLDKKLLSKNITEKVPLSSNLRFPIFAENRNSLIKYLKSFKIFLSDIWYDDVAKDCPNAVEISKKIFNLPTHINIKESEASKISERINIWLKSQ